MTNKDEQSQMLISKASSKWQNRQTASDDALTRNTHTHARAYSYTSLINFIIIAPFHNILNSFLFFFVAIAVVFNVFISTNKTKTNETKSKKIFYTFNA